MLQVNIKTVLSITGTVLGMAGTVVSSIANQKAMEEQVAKKVAEEVTKLSK